MALTTADKAFRGLPLQLCPGNGQRERAALKSTRGIEMDPFPGHFSDHLQDLTDSQNLDLRRANRTRAMLS